VLTGRHYDVDEARALGLLEEVVERDALRRAYDLAAACARGERSPLEEARERRLQARAGWDRPLDLPAGFLDGDARLRLLLRQALDPAVGRGTPAVRAVEALLHGLRAGFAAGCEREGYLFATLVVDERFGRRGIRKFLERREPAPLPPRRTERLGMKDTTDGLPSGGR
jgi:enoyl-CoA hydratase/carnithine racemase